MSNTGIFITGGGGYVGAALVPELLSLGYSVTVFDLFLYGESVLDDHPKLKKITGDIRNRGLLNKTIPGHNVVIHLACISNDPSFELNPSLGKSINLDAFQPLVETSEQCGVDRFIYASSSSVYGIKEEIDVDESVSLEPLTDYSRFKADCESILSNYQSDTFTTATLRPATVCGYSRRQRLDVVVNILANLAYHNREITVFGGDQLRPNIHISDMVDAYVQLLDAPKAAIGGEVYNAGYENQSVFELAQIVRSVIGEDVELKVTPTDDNRSYHISSHKIYRDIGFKAQRSIRDAVVDLREAFDRGKLPNSLEDKRYFNIRLMQAISLQ